MPVIDSTVGGLASNSYVSLLEANAYFESAYNKPLWAPLVDNVKAQLLISATVALDSYTTWLGQRYSISQVLDWPRVSVYDRDGMLYPYTVIPYTIKVATYELAYHLLANGGLTFTQNSIDEVKVGSIGIKFSNYITEMGIPAFVESILSHVGSPLYIDSGKVTMARLVRS